MRTGVVFQLLTFSVLFSFAFNLVPQPTFEKQNGLTLEPAIQTTYAATSTWSGTFWSSYDTITIEADEIDDDLTDFPVYVDLADLSASFWSTVSDGGGDIRVTTNEGSPTEVPREVVFASTSLQTGELHFKANLISSTTDTTFRIYYNGSTTAAYAKDDTYGAENVWTNNYFGVWHMQQDPTGTIYDSTANGRDGTSAGSMTSTDLVDGAIGKAINFDGTDDIISAGNFSETMSSMSVSTWIKPDTVTGNKDILAVENSWYSYLVGNDYTFFSDYSGTNGEWYVNNSINTNQYQYVHTTFTDIASTASDPSLYVNGSSYNTGDDAYAEYLTPTSSFLQPNANLVIAGYGTTATYDGNIDEIRLASTTRSEAWVAAEFVNQKTPDSFYTVNTESPNSWNATDWTLYDTVTIDATQVDATLTNFPVYVDLADLSSQFWSTTDSVYPGVDIRVTNSSNSELPRELVFASSTAQTGELHFKADSISSSVDTEFRIWYNGTTTNDYATDATYGAENVWTNEYIGVWHMQEDPTGIVYDSTSNNLDAASGGAMTSGDSVSGSLGSAVEFDGTNDIINTEIYNGDLGAVTITSWINPSSYGEAGFGRIAFYADAVTGFTTFITGSSFNRLQGIVTYTGTSGQWGSETDSLVTGKPQYIVWNKEDLNAPTTQPNMSIDGTDQTITTVDVGSGSYVQTVDAPFIIGNTADQSRTFDGYIDELRFASTTRSAAWISAEHLNQATTTDFYGVEARSSTALSWNATDWTLYDTITIDATQVDATLTDFPVYVDLADLSSQFWSTTDSVYPGVDIRVTNVSNTELPRELVFASSTAQTGELHFKADSISSSVDTEFRIWYNGTTTNDYAADATYGAENVWTNGYVGVWHMNEDPTGTVRDSTAYGRSATTSGSMTSDDLVDGVVGNALRFSTTTSDLINTGLFSMTLTDLSTEMWLRPTTFDDAWHRLLWAGGSWGVRILGWGVEHYNVVTDFDPSYADWNTTANNTAATGVFQHMYFGIADITATTSDPVMYKNGSSLSVTQSNFAGDNDSFTQPNVDLKLADNFAGDLDEIRIATTTRSDAWISAAYLNQSTTTDFYSTSAFAPTPTWNATDWTLFDTITIDSTQVDETLTDFPVYVDLADLSATFWATTPSASSTVGTDIRVTTLDNTELPRELVSASSTAQTGELHFKADSISATTDTTFKIWYNGSTAGDYAADAIYGAQNVWTNDYVVVMHLEEDGNTTAGGYFDSTSNANHGTGTSMTAASDVSAQLGKGQNFDGSADYITFDQAGLPFGTSSRTLSAWAKATALVGDGASNGLLSYGTGWTQTDPATSLATYGTPGYLYADGYDGGARVSTADFFDTTGQHYVASTYDGSVLRLYGDGGYLGGYTGTRSITAGAARIGDFANGSDQSWYGTIDEVRIASTSRSAAWLSAEYTNQGNTAGFYSVGTGSVIFAAEDQYFATDQAAALISPITVGGETTPTITAANDIRIAIATSTVDMRWDTSDTTAVITGDASGKVSTTVSYNGDGSVLVLDVTSDFASGESITISGLSFTSFNATNSATSGLSIRTGGVGDTTDEDGNGRTITIEQGWNGSQWTLSDSITIDHNQIDEDLTNFPVYVDLADLSATFWSTTPSGAGYVGTDIRITNSSNQELPYELVAASSTAQTGELHFKADLIASTTDTNFKIWYNGSTAVGGYHRTGTYGTENVWTNDYVVVMHLEEDGNTDIQGYTDSTGNKNHGTGRSLHSGSDTTTKLGRGVNLDGDLDFIEFGQNGLPFGTSSRTMSVWAKATALVSDGTSNGLMSYGSGYTNTSPATSLGTYSTASYLYADGYDGGSRVSTADFFDTTGQHFVASTYDGSVLRLYGDGGYIGGYTGERSLTAGTARAGNYGNGWDQSWYGTIDEVRVASTSRSTAWLSAEYENQNNTATFYSVGAGSIISAATDQYFATDQATAPISPITVGGETTPTITAANDIRIAIATSTVDMRWDTSDTTAVITGDASGKVSTTVSYNGDGSVLVIDVTSDFIANDIFTISGLSFTSFNATNSATSGLSIRTGGPGDTTDEDINNRTIAIEQGWNGTDWTVFDTITIDADQVDEDLTDFPVYVDLADLSATFWSTTPSGAGTVGTDIRITNTSNQEVPYELVAASSTAQTGELHFKASSISSSIDTTFKIWYNGSTAVGGYHRTGTYGTENVWTNDYVVVMHLEEDGNTDAEGYSDSTSNKNHGTGRSLHSGSDTTTQLGRGVDLDGNLDFIEFGQNGLPFGTASRTMSVWAKATALQSDGASNGLLSYGVGFTQTSGATSLGTYSTAGYLYADGYDGGARISQASFFDTTNQHFIASTYDGSVLRLYGDGSQLGSYTGTRSLSSGTARAGNYADGSDQSWYGTIDEVRVASTSRSTAWLSAVYMNQNDTTSFYTANVTSAATLSSAEDQNFAVGQATTTISTITVADNVVAASITAANDIRIAIATSTVDMRWDTTDTTATFGGTASGKVSGTVSYSGGGSVLVIDVTSDFTVADTLTISELSFVNFATANTATSALELHIDGGVAMTPESEDDKTVTITGTWNGTDWTLYDTITIDADKIDEDLTDFPVYVDLSDLSSQFWSTTPSASSTVGTDIRVTNISNEELPRELVTASSTAQTGELHFKADSVSAGADTTFKIWYNGSTEGDYGSASTYGAQNVWSNDYVVVMHLEEEGNTTVGGYLDSTSNANHGTGTSMTAASDISAQLGKGQDFDGSADYLDFGQTNLPFGTSSRTMSLWAKSDSTGGLDASGLMGYGTGHGATDDVTLFSRYGDTVYGDGAQHYWSSYSSYTLASDDFFDTTSQHYVASTYDGATFRLYGDGALLGANTTERNITPGTTRIGDFPDGFDYPWNGTIDEVRISSTTRSAAWIAAEYENQNNTTTFYTAGSGSIISAAADQYFATDQAAAVMSPITINESTTPTITATNDIRIAIATSTVDMRWDTTDTTAAITGGASGKVSTTVSYNGDGSVLVLDVTSDFAGGDTIIVSGLSFTSFNATNSATSGLSIRTGGPGDTTDEDINNRTIAIEQGWNGTDWTLYDTITIDADQVDEDLTDFPVYVDLADLSATFWSTTPSGADYVGTDIRVTNTSNEELPRELVSASSTAQTGELHFRADSISSSVDTTFRIWYNGSTTVGDYHRSGTYGTENVWTNDYVVVMHLEEEGNIAVDGYQDSTSYRNHGTGQSLSASTDVSTKLGKGQDLDGSGDRISFGDNGLPLGTAERTMSLWTKLDTSGFTGRGLMGYGQGHDAGDNMMDFSTYNGYFHADGAASYGNSYSSYVIRVSNFIGTGEQHYVASTYDGSTLRFYGDGSLLGSNTTVRSVSAGPARIGDYPDGYEATWDGTVDEVRIASTTRSAAWLAAEHINQATTTDFYTINLAPDAGTSTLANSDAGQVSNAFDFRNKTNEALFAFKLTPDTRNATVTDTIISLVGVHEIAVSNFSNITLYRDNNSDGVYDGGDTALDTGGVMSIDGQQGTLTFSADFLATTSTNYVVVADWNAPQRGAMMTMKLLASNVTMIDSVGAVSVSGGVSAVQHNRGGQGAGGVSSRIGGAAPVGDGVVGGGSQAGGGRIDTNTGGDTVGSETDYFWPTATGAGTWESAALAYDQTDGTYATTSTGSATQIYTSFGDTVPGTDTVGGLLVKLEISGTTAAGDIDVELSWDGGSSWTSSKSTGTLSDTDAVVTLGSVSDTWGRSWTPAEIANFAIRVTANPSSNEVRIDGIQARVYHTASGGGSGGGGRF